jgi:hypothetical protein
MIYLKMPDGKEWDVSKTNSRLWAISKPSGVPAPMSLISSLYELPSTNYRDVERG